MYEQGDWFLNEHGFFNRGSARMQKPYVTRRSQVGSNRPNRKTRYTMRAHQFFRAAQEFCDEAPHLTGSEKRLNDAAEDLLQQSETGASTVYEREEYLDRELARLSPMAPQRVKAIAKVMADRGMATSSRDAIRKAIVQVTAETFATQATPASLKGLGAYEGGSLLGMGLLAAGIYGLWRTMS